MLSYYILFGGKVLRNIKLVIMPFYFTYQLNSLSQQSVPNLDLIDGFSVSYFEVSTFEFPVAAPLFLVFSSTNFEKITKFMYRSQLLSMLMIIYDNGSIINVLNLALSILK